MGYNRQLNSFSGPLIFIIDDSELHNILLKKVLETRGFKVVAFNNSDSFLKRLYDEKPDLIISDIEMPHLNGFQLQQEVKKIPGCDSIPLIFLSSSDSAQVKERAERVGVHAHLSKPFDKENLYSVLTDCSPNGDVLLELE